MQPRLRPLLLSSLAFFGILSQATTTRAQTQTKDPDFNAFDDLVMVAPLTLTATYTTNQPAVSKTTPTGRIDTTTPAVTKFTQENAIKDLMDSGLIPSGDPKTWTLLAVRPAPADLAFVDSKFDIYAAKNPVPPSTAMTQRTWIPRSKFQSYGMESVERYTERSQGQYILSATGAVTNYARFRYTPSFIISSGTGTASTPAVNPISVTIDECISEANSTIAFATKEVNDVFFYAINSLRVTTRGFYTGRISGTSTVLKGLAAVTINTGTPKLALRSEYPEVSFFDGDFGSAFDDNPTLRSPLQSNN